MEHSFDIEIAKEHGVGAAILFKHFQIWIAKNKANGRNLRDGRTWTYNSLRALKDQHPYLSDWVLRQGLDKLIEARLLLKSNYNLKRYDRTTWYAFEDEKTALQGLTAWFSSERFSEFTGAVGYTAENLYVVIY